MTWDDAVAFCKWLSRKERKDVPLAHRSRMGVRLPRRVHDEILFRR